MKFFKKKIFVTDLKQYLINSFSENKELRNLSKKLKKQIDDLTENKEKYETTLIILEEYKNRNKEIKEELKEKEQSIKELKEKNKNLCSEIIEAKLSKEDIIKENNELRNNIEVEIEKGIDKSLNEYREFLINKIANTKGTLSKEKIKSLIKEN